MNPAALAALHARCFTLPPPWRAAAFTATLAGRGAFLLGDEGAFLVGRAIAGEAELLTLAVAPEMRRRGLARALCQQFATQSVARGASVAFLEVAADNSPARALYAGCGWVDTGCRRNYYGAGLDAVVMRLDLA